MRRRVGGRGLRHRVVEDDSNELRGADGPVRFRAMSTETAPQTATTARLSRVAAALETRLFTVVGAVVAVAAILIDQATKHWADITLTRGRFVEVLGDRLGLQLTFNDGGAWGFPAPSWFFLVVTVVVVVIVVRNLPHATSGRGATAYGLLLAGAVGNALDRVFRLGDAEDPRFLFGHVVDFVAVELPRWLGPLGGAFPRFNVADVAITIGFVLLAWELLVTPEDEDTGAAGSAASILEDDDDDEDDETVSTPLPVSVS